MRSVKESPVIRVIRTPRPYTATARQRWKERAFQATSSIVVSTDTIHWRPSAHAGLRRNRVEMVPEHRRDDCREDAAEEREPSSSSSASPRYSSSVSYIQQQQQQQQQQEIGESSAGPFSARCLDDNIQPPCCRLGENVEKISLVGILASNVANAQAVAMHHTGDVNAVDERFRGLSVIPVVGRAQEQRRAQKTQRQEKSVATRRRVLMNTLGMQKFYKALAIVREVKRLRESILRSCCSHDPLAAASVDKPLRQKSLSISKDKFEILPRSARDLLLNTNLVLALEQIEVERLPMLPWDELTMQAHQNTMAYKEWLSLSETRE